MNKLLLNFSKLLETRFKNQVITTEDSIRYTFFAALLDAGVSPHEIVLEFPHPSIPRAQIDTWLTNYQDNQLSVEFKYDRDPPGGKNQPKTQKAGSVFRDIRRQLLAKNTTGARSLFIYVTTEEMAVYFRNPNNGFEDFFNLLKDCCIELPETYFSGKSMTFNNTLGGVFNATIKCLKSDTLPGGHHLRIYEVLV